MKPLQNVLFGGLLILGTVGIASAQGSDPAASSTGAQASTEMSATTKTETSTDADASTKAIRDRAKSASPKARVAADAKFKKLSAEMDAEGSAKGGTVAAGRVASEFGMTGDALIAEETQYGAGLGEIVVAHTLMANSKTAITMDQLFAMRKDGMGWGQIAQGMDLRLGEAVSAVMSEGRVASGRAKADGKVAVIHTGSATAATHAGLGAGAHAGHAGAAGSVGVGAGVGAKVGK